MHLTDKEVLLSKQIHQAFIKAHEHQKPTLFRFMSLHEIEMIHLIHAQFKDVEVMTFGGYDDAEYQRVILSAFPIEKDDLKIVCLKILYNKRYITPSHRHVLGTLMSLGITRNHIGDIVVSDDIWVFVTKEMQSYIQEQLTTLLGHPIRCEETEYTEVSQDQGDLTRVFLMSLRLDAVIAHGFKLSRENAQAYIAAEKVKLNGKVTQNTSQNVKVYDIISIRGKGRIKIEAIQGQSKKGRTLVDLWILR